MKTEKLTDTEKILMDVLWEKENLGKRNNNINSNIEVFKTVF